jgi:hypothetical protein
MLVVVSDRLIPGNVIIKSGEDKQFFRQYCYNSDVSLNV